MHQKTKKKQISQRDDLFGNIEKGETRWRPVKRSPTPPANIHASPPQSHRPTTTAPQTNTAPPPVCLLHPAAAHTSGGEGLERQRSERSFGVFRNEKRKRFKREAKPACCEGRRPQVVFGNTLRPLGTTGSKSGENFCWRFLSNNSVVLCPDKKWQFFISLINSSIIIFWGRLSPLATACVSS